MRTPLTDEQKARKKKPVHKASQSFIGAIYDYCSGNISNSPYTHYWKKVTCKRCLAKRAREMVRG
jgi:hypothetical protein